MLELNIIDIRNSLYEIYGEPLKETKPEFFCNGYVCLYPHFKLGIDKQTYLYHPEKEKWIIIKLFTTDPKTQKVLSKKEILHDPKYFDKIGESVLIELLNLLN